jgi:thiamine transport system substrate-binding protein
MRHIVLRLALLIVILAIVAACGQETTQGTAATPAPETATEMPPPPEALPEIEPPVAATEAAGALDYGRVLTIMTHDSFNVSADVVAEFEQANQVNVRFLRSGDAGSVLNRAILARGNPLADVLFGVDNTFLSRAIEADIFEPYVPAGLESIPAELRLDPEGRLTPIDYGFVNFNYDRAAFGEGGLPVPEQLRDLTRPEYRGKIVVTSPATSSPGLAFLLTTIAAFGEDGDYPWTQFWTDLRANDVQVVNSWDTAYYTNFSGSSGQGEQPIVLSYATSPAAEVFFAEGELAESPTANLLPPQGAFRQIEFAGILRGTQNLELAQRWIDYMISPRFQADIPLQMFVYPANPEAEQPEVFQQFAQVPEEPAVIAPDEIAANRDQWIQEWTRIMQR